MSTFQNLATNAMYRLNSGHVLTVETNESVTAYMIAQTPLGAKNLIFLLGFIHTKKEIRFCICHNTLPKAEALFPGKQCQITSGSSIRISLHLSLDIK